MEFAVLGSVGVRDGPCRLAIGGPQQRRLLGVLLANDPDHVSIQRLVDTLWDTNPPPDAERSIRTYVARLRHTIGASLVVTHDTGYRLDLTGHTLDADDFVALLDAARAAEPAARLPLHDRALALWRGRPYGPFADEWWARPHAERLDELRLNALEARFDDLFDLGFHADAVPDLRRCVAEHPLRQHFVGQLMVALDRTGREVEAHRAFDELRCRLGDVGLEPGAELLRLDRAIAAGGAHPDASIGNLPRPRVELIGRDRNLDEALAALVPGRLVPLVGPGGVGKTSLAVAVAARARTRWADGGWFVSLAATRDPAQTMRVVVDDLGLRLAAARPNASAIAHALAHQSRLIVLDNCEHLLDEVTGFADTVLRTCPGITLLATSREALGCDSERVVPVRPLSLSTAAGRSDAAALFVERAIRAGTDVTLAVDGALVEEI